MIRPGGSRPRFIHPRDLAAPARALAQGQPSFLPWLSEHHPRLTMRDLSRLTGTAVYQGRTVAFRVLWALWHARGATLDALAQATTPDEEAFRGQAQASAFWRESLAHRVFSRWTDEAFPDRLEIGVPWRIPAWFGWTTRPPTAIRCSTPS